MKYLVQWKSVSAGSGAQCVITIGTIQMQLLSVDNLVSVQKVRKLLCHCKLVLVQISRHSTGLMYAIVRLGYLQESLY